MITTTQTVNHKDNHNKKFAPGELVTCHYKNEMRSIPIPGVVVRQDQTNVLIKARIQDKLQELYVDSDQLVTR